jgi:hypothetical protein
MSMFGDNTQHQRMAGAQDLDGDGKISPQEMAAYIQEYMRNASPEEQQEVLKGYVGNLNPQDRSQMADAMVRSPMSPVQQLDPNDDDQLANAYRQTAQAQPAQGKSPLETIFGQGGALSSPIAKAGLVGLAAMIGSRMLGRR